LNNMSQPHVIVCERGGIWAAALAKHLPREVRIRQTRALSECGAALAAAPTSLVALEVNAGNVSGALSWLVQMPTRFPLARAVVLADRRLVSYEWLLRDAGAVHFTTSPRELARVASIVRNHLSRLPASNASFAELMWDSLPWGEVATAR
jgi:hypothetical protein